MQDFRRFLSWLWIPWLLLAYAAGGLEWDQAQYVYKRIATPERLQAFLPIFGNPPSIPEKLPGDEIAARVKRSGLQPKDVVLEVDGQMLESRAAVRRAFRFSEPGQQLQVLVERNGQRLLIPVNAEPSPPLDPGDTTLILALKLILPIVFVIVGLLVSAVRISDPKAWSVTIMLLGFAALLQTPAPETDRTASIAYQQFFAGVWPLGMLAFVWLFPERLKLHRAVAATGLALFGILLTYLCWETYGAVVEEQSLAAAEPIKKLIESVGKPVTVIYYASIFLFFFFLQYRYRGTSISRDSRRRLKLLHSGAMVSFTPLLILSLMEQFTSIRPPRSVSLFVYAMLAIFPLSLAYIVVVDRALDLRVVLRSGVRYALARGTVFLLFPGAMAAAFYGFNLFEKNLMSANGQILAVAGSIGVALALTKVRERAMQWVDRRFFRDAYNSELVLTELSEDVRSIPDRSQLLGTLTSRLSESLHVQDIGVLIRTGDNLRLEHFHGADQPVGDSLSLQSVTVQEIARTKNPVKIYFDDPDSWINSEGGVTSEEKLVLANLNTQLLIPVLGRNQLIGVISLGGKRSEEPYTKNDVRLLTSIANQTGLALENVALTEAVASEAANRERTNRELEIAREVQSRLFPQKQLTFDGVDYYGFCRPARGVGGDYYDFIALSNGMLGIAIGDVSGKGYGAALTMASLQASLRAHTMDTPDNLSRVISNMNRLLFESSASNRYATFFYAQFDPLNRVLNYVNAGHNAPMVVRADGEVVRLDTGGPVIGLLPKTSYQQGRVQMERGDLLLAFTDGISEAMNLSEEEWGEDKLEQALLSCHQLPCSDVIMRLLNAADCHVCGAPQHDDITLVAVRF